MRENQQMTSELNDCLAPPAFDGHQIPKDLATGSPAGAVHPGHDLLGERLNPYVRLHFPTAVAEMDVRQFGKWGPGHMGELLPIIWTAAFVHHQCPRIGDW